MNLIESFSNWYSHNEYFFAALQLSSAMLGMGASTTTSDFVSLVKFPKALLVGLGFLMIGLPLLAYCWLLWGNLSVGYMMGIALFCLIPGGTTSNIFTFLARGNFALSIGLTAITTLACLVTLPFMLDLLLGHYLPSDFVMPKKQIIFDITFFLLLPLISGMIIGRIFIKHREIITTVCTRFSLIVVAIIIFASFTSGRLDWSILLNSSLVMVIAFVASYIVFSFLPILLVKRDFFSAIQIELLTRNINLGIMLLVSLFPAHGLSESQKLIGDEAFALLLFLAGPTLIFSIMLSVLYGRKAKVQA